MSAAIAGATLRTFVGLTISVLVLAPIASGQGASLTARLKAGVKCAEPDAGNELLRNADRSGADLTDILAALDDIAIEAKACIQIRDAASALALELNQAPDRNASSDLSPDISPDLSEDAPTPDVASVAAADARIQQILAEADARAASMRFEVGPPPRRITRDAEAPR